MHIRELDAEIQRYVNAKPDVVVRQQESDLDNFTGKLDTGGALPARLPIIVGDFLQNLRSALDYLVWELVGAANNQPSRENMFPICSTLDAFKAQIKRGRLQGMAPDAIAEIQSLQPYHLGQDFDKSTLFVIDDLCNINKHRRILLTSVHGGSVPFDEFQTVDIGGQPMVKIDVSRLNKDAKIGPFPIVDGTKVQVNSQVVAFIAFDEGAVKNMEMTHLMMSMMMFIRDEVIPKFERFFV